MKALNPQEAKENKANIFDSNPNSPNDIKSCLSRKATDPILHRNRSASAASSFKSNKKTFSSKNSTNDCKIGCFIYSLPSCKNKTYTYTEWAQIRDKMRGSYNISTDDKNLFTYNTKSVKGKSTPNQTKQLWTNCSMKNLLNNSYVGNRYSSDSATYYGRTIGKRTFSVSTYKNKETESKTLKPQVRVNVSTKIVILELLS